MSDDKGSKSSSSQSVLRGTGYEDTLERIYTTALKNNTNILVWERLLARARNSDNKGIAELMVWMKKAYSMLNKVPASALVKLANCSFRHRFGVCHITGIKLSKHETDDRTDWKTDLDTIRNLDTP